MNQERHPALQTWPSAGRVVIFDLEWTAWEGSLACNWSRPGEYRELIQIGAVRLDASMFKEIESFELLVKPERNPKLSSYISSLTGITDERVSEEGVSFSAALTLFGEFIDADRALYNGGDARVLEENCELRDMPYPWSTDRCANIRPALERVTGLRGQDLVSSNLPALLGCGQGFARHSGLGDARAIAQALEALRARGLI